MKRIGAGAQAEVYLAATRDEELIALKVMLEHLTLRDDSRQAFVREARTTALLKHPNVVEIYDVGESDGRPWIAMELVRGVSLSALMKKLRPQGVRLDQDEAAEIVRQAALGLHYAHEVKGREGEALGLVHRDVSPQNIMLSEKGIAKIVDFGLAKATARSETVTAMIKGKLRYMPPEQLKSQKLDRRTDVFALGAVLWELACGIHLYPGTSEAEVVQQALYNPVPHPDEVAKGLSRGMVSVLLAATQRDLDKRMSSAKELAEALAPLSSPHAREKLGERMSRLFERLPRTLDEAKGNEVSSPTIADPRPLKKSRAVLAPPIPKQSYVAPGPGPVPEPEGFRERRTDQVEARRTKSEAEPQTRPGPPVPDEPSSGSISVVTIGNGTPLMDDDDGDSQATDSGMAPLMEHDTMAMSSPSMTALDEDPTNASLIAPPSRRVVVIAVSASIGLVALGGLVGVLLRSGGAQSDEVPPIEEAAAEAPAVDGGPRTAAAVASKKKPEAANPRLGRVDIDANVTAVVRERGVDLGVTPFSKQLSPGRHKLSIATPDGSASVEIDVVVKPGETFKRTVKLTTR
ncbi:MAG: serine/threonine protein kinase [Myxococcaceae bacterium]|nr:serine/threonine protein kinase [Myxococcaceae bacterium]